MVTRHLTHALASLLLLSGIACHEEFTPKGDFEERAVVFAVVQTTLVNTTTRTTISAVVMHSFDVEGVNPAGATIDPSIRGASVRVSYRGTVDTLRERRRGVDSVTGIGPRWCYAGSLSARPGDTVALTADLPDGRRLTARTKIPPHREPTTFPDFPGVGMRTPSDPYVYGTSWIFDWGAAPGDQDLFFPSLYLIYQHLEDTGYVGRSRQVPLTMVNRGGTMVPEFSGPTTTSRVEFAFSAMDATMAAISDGDPEKSRYRILGFRWQFTEYDFPLSRYYSSVNGYLDAYSVRLDETVFSNISGGIGVFGSTYGYSYDYAIDSRYAEEFGYTTP
jgi:hypothetical protein